MPAETAEKTGLSKLDLTALKKANTVVFRHGLNTIECLKDPSEDDLYKEEKRYLIQVASRITDYGSRYTSESPLNYAVEVLHHCQFDDTWRTVLAFVREGDDLRLEWLAANNNDYLKRSGLFNDELKLKIHRNHQVYLFNIRQSICPDNTARMIRCV